MINSFHDHSSDKSIKTILQILGSEDCVYVSDAGSPIISDPAFPLVKACLEREVPVKTVSGISAVITALELSGLPPLPFHFYGFLSRDKGKVKSEVERFKNSYGTHIFFEGVSRVISTLDIITKQLPSCEFAVCRELTKEYESVYRFKGEDFGQIKNDIIEKGEFVILVRNDKKTTQMDSETLSLAIDIIENGAKTKSLAKLLAKITDKDSKELYKALTKK